MLSLRSRIDVLERASPKHHGPMLQLFIRTASVDDRARLGKTERSASATPRAQTTAPDVPVDKTAMRGKRFGIGTGEYVMR
jgi:hypothetical protein